MLIKSSSVLQSNTAFKNTDTKRRPFQAIYPTVIASIIDKYKTTNHLNIPTDKYITYRDQEREYMYHNITKQHKKAFIFPDTAQSESFYHHSIPIQ